MKYFVATAASYDALVESVNAKIADGWAPLGGIQCDSCDKTVYLCQAMVLAEEEQPEWTKQLLGMMEQLLNAILMPRS